MLLAEQQINQRPVHPGPLVLRTAPLKYPSPIKAVRELGSERRETVRSLDVYKRQGEYCTMGETLMQQRRVSEEVFRYVKLYQQERK